MRLAFFGTPEFAVPALRGLVGEGFDVQAVVTRPDRPQGRSRSRLVPSPVKEAALDEGLPVLQPERPDDAGFVAQLREIGPDLGIVVAYGHILKPELLQLPTHGMINVHASLLPALRGAAPIQRAIMEGLEETGITIMQMDAGMDTGPILHQVPTPIATDETGGELEMRLAEIGVLALIEALALMETGALVPRDQDDARASYAPKLTVDAARLDWSQGNARVARLIRGLDPRPGAWTTLHDRRIKLFGPRPAGSPPAQARPGEIVEVEPALLVATGDGLLQVLDVQPEGKSRLAAADWIRGRGARPGDCFR